MISLAATSDVVHAINGARNIALCAYALGSGRMRRTLEAAAKSGAKVEVRLEGRPYGDVAGRLARANREVIARLRQAGADARLVDRDGKRPWHMKAAVVDGVAYLDDRNWPTSEDNTIVRDDDPHDVNVVRAALEGYARADRALATNKGNALRLEAGVLKRALQTRTATCVESESFTAGTATYKTIKALARAGVPVRLLVAQQDLKPATRGALAALQRAGVAVRRSGDSEKLAIGTSQAWVGSANASYGNADQIDWGLRVTSRVMVADLRARFESNWAHAKPLAAREVRTVPGRSHR